MSVWPGVYGVNYATLQCFLTANGDDPSYCNVYKAPIDADPGMVRMHTTCFDASGAAPSRKPNFDQILFSDITAPGPC